jgi:ribosomal-protein-alanine N-acetyltransferase
LFSVPRGQDSVLPEGYTARELAVADAAALAAAYRRNREHLRPWDPRRAKEFFTEEGQEAAVAAQLRLVAAGTLYAWVIVAEGRIVGRVNLNNVVQGIFRSASLGYWVDVGHLRRGVARGAVRFACAEARRRGLHRVEAGTLTHNEASQRVLLGCGFELFGTAERYLFIDGAWRDHNLYQRILHDEPL